MDTFTVEGITYEGEMLGRGSSKSETHTHTGVYLQAGQRENGRKKSCSACRWEEAVIYGLDDADESYLVHVVGHSIVPGEVPYIKTVRTISIYTVLETLIVPKPSGSFLPAPARVAIAEAAQHDSGMESLYRNLPKDLF